MTRTVRTTIRPDLEVEVDEAEYLDLSRMGLLIDDEPRSKAAYPKVANPARTEA